MRRLVLIIVSFVATVSIVIAVRQTIRYGPLLAAPPQAPSHSRPIIESDGRTLLWARGDPDSDDAEWFDMTDARVEPAKFQYGIGKDTIPSIDKPEFARPDDPRLAEFGIDEETEVIGYAHNGVAKAYPLRLLNRHEVVNDEFDGVPFAVCW